MRFPKLDLDLDDEISDNVVMIVRNDGILSDDLDNAGIELRLLEVEMIANK